MPPRRLRALLTLVLLLALTACRVDTTVTVALGGDGSGVLRIEAVADEELVARATAFGGTDPVADFRTSDLEAAGWRVVKDAAAHRITLEHSFRTVDELGAVVATLDPGASSPVLHDFAAARDHSLFSDVYRISGEIDLGQGGSAEPIAQLLQGVDPTVVGRLAGGDLAASRITRPPAVATVRRFVRWLVALIEYERPAAS